MSYDENEVMNTYRQRIQAIDKLRTFSNRRYIKRAKIAALEEAQRDILNTDVARGARSQGSRIDKNSYPTYETQVFQSYKMYNGYTDYGSELFSSVADMRVAFIGGEGISFTTKNEAKTKFLDCFLKSNHLRGSKLLLAVLMGEMEGKVLFTLAPVDKKGNKEAYIKARLFSWYQNKYVVNRNKDDYETIDSISYKKNESDSQESKIDLTKSVYVKLGGPDYNKFDNTTTKLGKILTQCENASRATYDLRKNTHYFGKIMPFWKTLNPQDSTYINSALANKSFEIGDGYAGPADFSLVEPTGAAGEVILKDTLASLRYICSMTGVPIHWMAWPELMSNRATAENLMEVVYAATKKERLIWEEGIIDLFDRAMEMAVESGIADRAILDDELSVKLPLISLAALKQMVDVWLPIYQEKLVSKFTMMNMLPGIDPDEEQVLLDEERESAIQNSPLLNMSNKQEKPVIDPNINMSNKQEKPVIDPNIEDQNTQNQGDLHGSSYTK